MNVQVNNEEYEFLWKLLANPADPNHSYIFNLQSLVSDFPQSGVLRALLMPNGDKRHLKHAAAYYNPRVLHKLSTAPDSLPRVSPDQIIISDELETGVTENYFNIPAAEPFVPPVTDEPESDFTPVIDDSAEETLEVNPAEEITVTKQPEASYNTFSEPEAIETSNVDDQPIVDPSRENTPAYIDEDEQPEDQQSAELPSYIHGLEPFEFQKELSAGTPIDEDPVHEEIAEAPIIEQYKQPEPAPVVDEPAEEVPAEQPAKETVEQPVEQEPAEQPIKEAVEETVTEDSLEQFIADTTPQPAELPMGQVELEDSLAKQYDAYLAESEAAPTHPVSSYDDGGDRYFHQAIDDEVYDEIVSIEDIGLEQLAILNKSAREAGQAEESYFVFEPEEIAEVDTTSAIETPQPEATQPEAQPETSAIATPVIRHEPTEPEPADSKQEPLAEQDLAEQVNMHPAVVNELPIAQHHDTFFDEKSNVSMYNDERMPYSFLWWLDKTRKEHAEIYQPYAGKPAPAAAAVEVPQQKEPLDELQKQYYQNIVSTTSIAELDKNPPKAPPAHQPRKEDKIIERFIHEEPQIKHPTGVKLDNENKAKRSSEDKEDLVTETLARIYTEQMLYHKAILTYKKLMLKYPEKSLYFAGQIEQLESKIN